jgi:hypothetical protein
LEFLKHAKSFFFYIKWSRLVDHSETFEWLWQPSGFSHLKTGPEFLLLSWTIIYERKTCYDSFHILNGPA